LYVVAIIAAGGYGRRLGAATPKQLLDLGGRTLLQRSVDVFDRCGRVDEIVVVLPPDLASAGVVALRPTRKPLAIVAGGARRQDSVANGFDHVVGRADLVVVHDAARPFASEALITRTIDAAAESGAALAALRARDTVKQAAAGGLLVAATLPREAIYLAQTPQAFRADVLRDAVALGRRGTDATDEAALAEQAGHPVRLVEGEAHNLKITTEDDLVIARALSGEGVGLPRAGTGYDLHRLVEGRPLVLAGVRVPSDRGPLGHSDGDVVCHAVVDALLGAAAAGDIGQHFPDTDPRWKDAPGLDLLARAAAMVREKGFSVANVDVVVVLERPKIRPHVEAIRAALAGALGVGLESVSVKGKTNEGVDATGRGEAIAAHAVALVVNSGF
jgi:2-C-methyl-D-erythritol 4-phosphate cytidylyltransferase/2-C-methyl-D-erythritol 2,4-cyclodiphosphate synthase